jgi:hypothetical protein
MEMVKAHPSLAMISIIAVLVLVFSIAAQTVDVTACRGWSASMLCSSGMVSIRPG